MKTSPEIEIGADLTFGTVSAGSAAGMISVSPQGTQLCSSSLTCLGGQQAGLIYVTGRKDFIVAISLGNAELTSGTDRLTARLTPSDTLLILEPGRRKNHFTLGGTLTLAPHQAEGAYSGSYDVIVEYQ